jgi:TDG/mug DNA glycosylase family protein
LPEWGYGITNLVSRPTAGIDELTRAEYRAGARTLLRKIGRHRPRVIALVGVTVWRAVADALGVADARSARVTLGFQQMVIEGARVCVLPNPSGRNATLGYAEMVRAFAVLEQAGTTRGRVGPRVKP